MISFTVITDVPAPMDLRLGIDVGEIALNSEDFEVNSPTLLYAKTRVISDQLCLIVYRSVAVKLHYELYEPVAKFLNDREHLKIDEVEHDDGTMMRGRAVATTYLLF